MAHSVAQPLMTAGLVVCALLAGCTGNDRETGSPDTTRWRESANELCRSVDPVPLPVNEPADLDQLNDAERGPYLDSYRRAHEMATELTRELSELDEAPSGATQFLRELLTDTVELGAALEASADVGNDGLAFASARLRITGNAVAQKLDLDECSDTLGTWSMGSAPAAAPLSPDVVCLIAPGSDNRPGALDADALATAEPVPCDTAHDIERYLAFEAFPGAGTDFPGQIVLAEQAAAQCGAAFDDAFGTPAVSDPSTYVAIVPDVSTWLDGDSLIHCVRIDLSGRSRERSAPEKSANEN